MIPSQTIVARLVLGALPLLVYPGILVAGVMSLAGHRTGNEPALQMAIAQTFLWGTIAYPLVYFPCLVFALVMRKRRERAALRASTIPFQFLALLAVSLGAWILVG